MKKNLFLLVIILALLLSGACKQKKKEKRPEDRFFPVLSFIQSQVAHIDTSLYPIRKLVYVDSTRTDTLFIKREQFRELASDFLRLPDLSDSKFEDRYIEKRTFDTTLNRVILILEPVKPEKEEIQRQEVLIRPDNTGDRVTSIIIDYLLNNKDSLVQKRMLWQVDKSFQVIITRQLPGQAEMSTTSKVIWNEENDE
jgi:hypothetical protein